MEKTNCCPHCGAKMKEWEQRLTPGLVDLLLKFAIAIKTSGKNDIHFQEEISSKANHCNNFPKLRYFGLIAKVRNDEGTHKQGHWLLTRRGGEFLRGDAVSPVWIRTFRNEIVAKSDELKFIWDVAHDYDRGYFQTEFNFNIADGKVI